jgi:hypothetical protein
MMNGEMMKSKEMIWPASLGISTILGCLLLACIFPFAAFATLAALTMKPRNAMLLLTGVWGINQAIGFFILSFPWDAQALGHGIAILVAMMLAYAAATSVLPFTKSKSVPMMLSVPLALAAAFAIQQLALRAYAGFGGGAENFSAEIITAVGVENLFWFAGLLALRFFIAQGLGDKRPIAA